MKKYEQETIILQDDINYPKFLKEIKKPPIKLYVKGNIELLNKPSIAIVGSRNYTEYGKKMAKKFSKDLVNEGFAIVSGLALGIDSFAHEECINSGGKTIAVIACGFNKMFPKENKNLYEKIVQSNGCVISEYSQNIEAQSKYFPTRNRLISGLALGTLIIEANYRSGTSITARYCIEQNRKLFCIPNSIESKNAIGTNNLIKKGANLVTDVKDITKIIGDIQNKVKIKKVKLKEDMSEKEKKLSGKELKIYKILKERPRFSDELVNYSKLNISEINEILSILEIEDYIVKISNNKYMVKNNE